MIHRVVDGVLNAQAAQKVKRTKCCPRFKEVEAKNSMYRGTVEMLYGDGIAAFGKHRLPACSSRQLGEMPLRSIVDVRQNVVGRVPATTG
jgi:hypothetical protein